MTAVARDTAQQPIHISRIFAAQTVTRWFRRSYADPFHSTHHECCLGINIIYTQRRSTSITKYVLTVLLEGKPPTAFNVGDDPTDTGLLRNGESSSREDDFRPAGRTPSPYRMSSMMSFIVSTGNWRMKHGRLSAW